jgi:hypothetical protein
VSAEWLTREFDDRRRKRVLVKIIGESVHAALS